jgi:hypothetical protein
MDKFKIGEEKLILDLYLKGNFTLELAWMCWAKMVWM